MPIGGRQAGVDDQAGPVLHQGVPEIGELGLHARAFAISRIGRRGVRLVRALLALEVDIAISARAGRRLVAGAVLGPKTLHRSPSLNQCAVDGKVVASVMASDVKSLV
jgi:hypothetical protein